MELDMENPMSTKKKKKKKKKSNFYMEMHS